MTDGRTVTESNTMPARIQDVQPTDCHGQLGYSFTVWDDDNKIALTRAKVQSGGMFWPDF